MNLSSDREEILFAEALARPAGERAAFLDQACGEDHALRSRVGALLAAHESPESTLGVPVVRSALFSGERLGSRIGHYVLLEKIGEGGCGTVYLAEQQEPVRRQVALKVIKLGMDSADVVARFEAERQVLALMNHPNIANVLDAGATDTGRPYFVMELVTGTRITNYCDENNLSLADRLGLFVQVCHAIQHAHQKGIIHRDIKPSNILVTVCDGVPVPKVIDFGIAKATQGHLADRTVLTAIAQFVGTPVYMSPEQAEFSSRDIDTRSDIYSLGVLLYELIAGRPPFDPESLLHAGLDEIRRQIREVDPPRPSTRLSTLTDADRASIAQRRNTEPARLATLLRSDLDWIVMRCLEKDRARRYETANGLAADVERHLNHEPVTASPPSAVYRLRKLVVRHRAFFAAAAVVMFALLVGTVVSTWQAVRATRAERLASQRMQSELAARQDAEKQRQIAVDQFAAAAAAQHDAEKQRALAEDRLRSETAARRESEQQKMLAEQERVRAQTAEKVAHAEAQISQAVNDFLQEDLLRQADSRTQAYSRNSPNPDLTMRAALDRAAERVGQRFRHQPLVEAGIRDAIGKTYIGLGVFDRAADHFERALQLRKAELGEEHASTLSAMHHLGTIYAKQQRLSEAATLLERTLKLRKSALGPDHVDTLNTTNSLALVYWEQRRTAEAAVLLQPVLESNRRLLGPESPNTLTAAANLATLYHSLGRRAEATRIFADTLKVQERVLGTDHPDTLSTTNNLAMVYMTSGMSDDAAPLIERVVTVRKRVLGPQHPETLQAMSDLASTYRNQGRLEKSAELLEETVATQRRVLKSEHLDTLVAISNLGCTYWSQGRQAEATALFAETAQGEKRVIGLEHPETLRSMSNLAGAYCAQGRYDDAAPILHETLGVRQRVFGRKHRGTFANAKELGSVYLRQGNYPAAEDLLLRNCYDNLRHTELDTHLADAQMNEELDLTELLADLYTQWGNGDEAGRWRHRHSALRRLAAGWNEVEVSAMHFSTRLDFPDIKRIAESYPSRTSTRTTTGNSLFDSTNRTPTSTSSRPPTTTSTTTPGATTTPATTTPAATTPPPVTTPGTTPPSNRHAGFRPTPPDSSGNRHLAPGSGSGRPPPPAGVSPPNSSGRPPPPRASGSPPSSSGSPGRTPAPRSTGTSSGTSSSSSSNSSSSSSGSRSSTSSTAK